jgi:acetyltransferase-like isoleucine patch superfamily enzyme
MEFRHLGEGAVINDPHLSIFLKPEAISIGRFARLDGAIKIEGGLGVTIGAYTHCSSFCHINGGGGQVTIGAFSGLASGVKVAGGQTDFSYLYISPVEFEGQVGQVIRKHTIIGEHVIIFSNAVILPGVHIGTGAIVAAGAVVTKDVEAFSIVAGVPARVVGIREITSV